MSTIFSKGGLFSSRTSHLLRVLHLLLILSILFALAPEACSFGWDSRRLKGLSKVQLLFRGGSANDESGVIPHHFLSEAVLFEGKWRSLVNRHVQLPSGAKADFEIVSQKGTDQAVLIFVWDSATKTTTLIREFMPASDGMKLGLAAGVVDEKHITGNGENFILMAAQFELEEECRLTGGKWYTLVVNVLMDKYSTTKLSVYLVIDPISVELANARPRDELEEGMQVLPLVSIDQLLTWIDEGHTTVVGSWACLLALRKLREMEEIN